MPNLEIEYKTLLNEIEFKRLELDFISSFPVKQTNYYIDTVIYDMKRKKMSLRVRILKQHAELTLKIDKKVGILEYNQHLNLKQAHQILESYQFPKGEILKLLEEYEVSTSHLIVLGHLITIRREQKNEVGLMALDKNCYFSQTDYELEVEVDDPEIGKVAFDRYLSSRKIKFKHAKSKVARLFAISNRDKV